MFLERFLSKLFLYIVLSFVIPLRQILYGCVAQYLIMPAFGVIVSKLLGLSPSLSVGLILLACCPGGTASNVVRAIYYIVFHVFPCLSRVMG